MASLVPGSCAHAIGDVAVSAAAETATIPFRRLLRLHNLGRCSQPIQVEVILACPQGKEVRALERPPFYHF